MFLGFLYWKKTEPIISNLTIIYKIPYSKAFILPFYFYIELYKPLLLEGELEEDLKDYYDYVNAGDFYIEKNIPELLNPFKYISNKDLIAELSLYAIYLREYEHLLVDDEIIEKIVTYYSKMYKEEQCEILSLVKKKIKKTKE